MTTPLSARETISKLLTPQYGEQEARSIATRLVEEVCQLPLTSLLLVGKDTALSPSQVEALDQYTRQLQTGMPLQYVLERADFYRHSLYIAPGALIPRPETEELVELILNSPQTSRAERILDLGTGSGCIAYSLSAHLSREVEIDALELDPTTAQIAQRNFDSLHSSQGHCPRLIIGDMLRLASSPPPERGYDLIVSNPPYIHPQEAEGMQEHVLNHEPHQALFAPSQQPTIFYDAIGEMASMGWLAPQGEIYVELNPIYAEATLHALSAPLRSQGYEAHLLHDMSGQLRFAHLRLA